MSLPDSTLQLSPLATLHPPSSARAWLSAPHPTVPILATACEDKSVRLYSLRSYQLIEAIGGGHKRSVRSVAWKPGVDGGAVGEGGGGGGTDGKGGGHMKAGNKKGRREDWVFATGSFDATAGIWRRKERWDLVDSDAGERMSVDGDGDDVGGGGGGARGTRGGLGDGEGDDDSEDDEDEEWRYAVALEGHDSEIKSVAWSPTGQFLATCARDKSVWIWEEVIDSFGGGGAAGTSFGGVDADSSDNFETVAVLSEHEGDVKCVAWHPSPDFNLLASGSYDDTIRLYRDDIDDDWSCVAVLSGHEDTVWFVDFEGLGLTTPVWPGVEGIGKGAEKEKEKEELSMAQAKQRKRRVVAGPRLVSSSADGTVRVWTKVPSPSSLEEQDANVASQPVQPRVPSIIRSAAATAALDEEWVEECELPRRHDEGAAVYAVAWSKKSGRIVSTGSDGRVVVYKEVWKVKREDTSTSMTEHENIINNNSSSTMVDGPADAEEDRGTMWVVVAEIEAAHGVYEINHVCWAPRWDSRRGHVDFNVANGVTSDSHESSNSNEEEVIITTGDDGAVKLWTLR